MSPTEPAPLTLTASEAAVLTDLMGDVQAAASAFYAKTAESADVQSLGTEVRAFLSAAQTLNERLSGSISDKAAYRSALSEAGNSELLDAVRYVRNVTQHVLHVVRPSDDSVAVIGGLHGLRTYVVWDDVPPAAHESLFTTTQGFDRPSKRGSVDKRSRA